LLYKTVMSKNLLIRQGDVLLIPTDFADSADWQPEPKDPRGLVLAEGETSGHHHQLFGRGHKLFRFRDTQQRVLIVGRSGGELRVVGGGTGGVDRHTPISLAPGKYMVRIQRSWTSEQASRQVQD
jgi:hypothetical protein